MLQHTFIHLRGVGAATERDLWRRGFRSWDEFLTGCRTWRLANRPLRQLEPAVLAAQAALGKGDIEYFERALPPSERWRMYPDFADRVGFVDIETTGLQPRVDQITVIGLLARGRYQSFVRGQNLAQFPAAAMECDLLVTFNGASFDLPFLRHQFPRLRVRAHLDLRYPLNRLGLWGGLKVAEGAVGVRRPRALRDLNGFDAIRLWRDHTRGRKGALKTLLAYAQADVEGLPRLAALVAQRLPALIGAPTTEAV